MKGMLEQRKIIKKLALRRQMALLVALPLAFSMAFGSPANAIIDVWKTFYDSGVASLDAGELATARIKLNLANSLTASDNDRRLATLRALASLYEQTGETVLQERALLDQLAIYKAMHERSSVRLANVYSQLAAAKGYNNEYAGAMKYGQMAVSMLKENRDASNTELGISINNLAWAEEHSGRADLAEIHYREAMQVLARKDTLSVMYGMTTLNLAEHYRSHNKPQQALKMYRRSLRTFRQILDYDDDLIEEVDRRINTLERELNHNKRMPQNDLPGKDYGSVC